VGELTLDGPSHTYRVGDRVITSVTTILKAQGLYNYAGVDQNMVRHAGLRGDLIHDAIHTFHSTGQWTDAGEVMPEAEPYLVGYRLFLSDTKFRCLHSELMLYCDRIWIAGTIDDVGLMWGTTPGILEVKSTLVLNKEAARLQLAGYRWLYHRSGLEPKVPGANRWSLHLKPDGTYKLDRYKSYHLDITDFLAHLGDYRKERK
jgi:hypothetical protein